MQLYKSASVYADCEEKNYKPKKNVKITEFEIIEEYKGKDLQGKKYVPLFNYFKEKMEPRGCFQVLCGDWVTSSSGTGIVHTSPAFGADDYSTCKDANIIDPGDPCVTIDDSGLFTDLVPDY